MASTKRSAARAGKRKTQRNATSQRAGEFVWVKTFLRVLAINGNVTMACNAARIDRTTAYNHRNGDEAFKAQWVAALDQAADTLEAAAWKRGVKGVKRVVHSAGKVVGYEIEYSDSLLQTLLKAKRPTEYRERIQIEHVAINEAMPVLKELAEFLKAENLDFTEAQRQFLEMLKAAKTRAAMKQIEAATK